MGERHLGIKLVVEVDVVEEVLAEFLWQQSVGEGTFSASLLSDEYRGYLVAMKHVHVEPQCHGRAEPGGAPA